MGLDVHRLRALFPACNQRIYLNHAGVAPCSTLTRDAVHAWVDDLTAQGFHGEEPWESSLARARARAARLVGAQPHEIAFVRSTSHGISLIAEGLDWQPGDELLINSTVEYPANVYAWQQLSRRGVAVRELPAGRSGATVDCIEESLTERTRLVAVSSAQFSTGVQTDLATLGELCAQHDVLLSVDGIQTVGAFPMNVKQAGIHFMAADSHKWMLGLAGIGILFVDESVVDQVRPVLVGWRTTQNMWAFDGAHFQMRKDATKFEEGSLPFALIDGLDASLALLEEVGIDQISSHITDLLTRLEDGLTALGCEVTPPPHQRAGILLFVPPQASAEALYEQLAADGFALSLRRGMIRVSPHMYNTRGEIDQLIAAVRDHRG